MRYDLNNYVAEAKERGILVRFPDTDVDTYEVQFEDLIQWDSRNNHDWVIVYERNYKPVAFYDPLTLEGFILQQADWTREQQREAPTHDHPMTTDTQVNKMVTEALRNLSTFNLQVYKEKLQVTPKIKNVRQYLESATIYATHNPQTDRAAFDRRLTTQLQEVMPGNYAIRLREYPDGKLWIDMEFTTPEDETFFLLKYAWWHYFSWSYPWLCWPWPAQFWL